MTASRSRPDRAGCGTQRGGSVEADRVEDGLARLAAGTAAQREDLVERDAEAPDVGAAADGGAGDLLGRHVGGSAAERERIAERPGSASSRASPKSSDERLARLVDDDVRGLHVAMEDPLVVGVSEGVGDLDGDAEGALDVGEAGGSWRAGEAIRWVWSRGPVGGDIEPAKAGGPKPAVRSSSASSRREVHREAAEGRRGRRAALHRVDRLRQRAAADELHRVVVVSADLAERVDRDDVRVVELRDRLGLALEPLDARRARAELGRQDLERDLAAERVLDRAEHDAHAAAADLVEDAGTGRACGRAPAPRSSVTTSARLVRRDRPRPGTGRRPPPRGSGG